MNGKDDFEERFQLFKSKDAFINEWNTQADQHTVAHNMFSDFTQEEYRVRLGAKPHDTTGMTFVTPELTGRPQ